jgi:hypothetical protein
MVVDNLVNSSNALVDYLQLKNTSVNEITESVNELKKNEEENLESITNKGKKIIANQNKTIKGKNKPKLDINFLLVIALIISFVFNILTWWFKPNAIINLPENKENNLNIETQGTETIIDNPPSIISTQKKNTNDIREDNILNDSNSREIINNELLENITENVGVDQQKITENNGIGDNNVPKIPENNIQEDLFLSLTPKQYLLKNIKNQIADITNKYGKKLIIKIEANFNKNSLIITLSEDWYSLSNSQKNSLVKDIFNKVKTLDFYKFNIQDINEKLLARNAVVGNEFIIINED